MEGGAIEMSKESIRPRNTRSWQTDSQARRWDGALALLMSLMLTSNSALAQTADLPRTVPRTNTEIQLSFSPVVKQVAPAVVNVYATRTVRQSVSPIFEDPFFRRFFGDLGDFPGRSRQQSSLGSGVVVDAQGIVVTNHHVIEGAEEVRVALADRREFDADIVLKDERTDLAVLRIRALDEPLPRIELAEADDLEVGDLVLAVGNPFGVGQTVTQGIVSALARNRVGATDYQFFIQTDAAINPGNSGGALVDTAGRLVGINTAIFSRGGGSIGIGFAIPADMVRFVVAAAESGNVVRRPWLGATVQAVTLDIAESLGLDRPQGVLVTDILPDGPAAWAGLRVGDLILAVEGRDVFDVDSFGYRFAIRPLGGEATLTVRRDNQALDLTLAIIPPPETVPRDERLLRGPSPLAGATVMNLSPAVAQELGVEDMVDGVVVAEIAAGSPARRVGLAPGDRIVRLNGDVVPNTRWLDRATATPQRAWLLDLERGGKRLRLQLRG